MDATELDIDAKLYKASGDLIAELQAKLPLLVWHGGGAQGGKRRLRTHVPSAKSAGLCLILDRFQEWPQLLDPVLTSLLGTLVEGFTTFITQCPEAYDCKSQSGASSDVIPLPTALSQLLYSFCKVRGYKVILRFLSNEPRYVEPMIRCIQVWNDSEVSRSMARSGLVWPQKYVMLLWLSHLMLAPFELSTLSAAASAEAAKKIPSMDRELQPLCQTLPAVAQDVLSIALGSLTSPSKERESAIILLVRLALRRDMQTRHLAAGLVQHFSNCLLHGEPQTQTVYHYLGHLALLYSIVNLGTAAEVAPFLARVYSLAEEVAISDSGTRASIRAIRDLAPARKYLVKILRVCLTHAIALTDAAEELDEETTNSWLESGIQYFLESLGDKDGVVRMAASKALSLVALKLDPSLAAEIIEAVLAALSENVLLEDPRTMQVMARTDLSPDQSARYVRSLSAVDALKWHGLMLTLGHLLFRRSAPLHQLGEIIQNLLLGLDFEQRSHAGTSLGVSVRDGACFGLWALARKYTTKELEAVAVTSASASGPGPRSGSPQSNSILQTVATRLVLSACLDPSGNIRRGSSAALQELIGRHPDSIVQGIAVVQVVDYTAVARRSKAMIEVGTQAAGLAEEYHQSLLLALLGWRGARAVDADSRRWAAAAFQTLCTPSNPSSHVARLQMLQKLKVELYGLGPLNIAARAAARHGLLLCMASAINSVLASSTAPEARQVWQLVDSIDLVVAAGDLDSRATADLELAMEGICTFVASFARLRAGVGVEDDKDNNKNKNKNNTFAKEILPLIDRCIVTAERGVTIEASATAIVAVSPLLQESDEIALLDRWFDPKQQQKHSDLVCKGRLVAMAQLYAFCKHGALKRRIASFLQELIVATSGPVSIEVKTAAMESLCILIRSLPSGEVSSSLPTLQDALMAGLTDYTNDQRGDIGSLLRLQSLDAVEAVQKHANTYADDAHQDLRLLHELTPYVARLAAEKLNKVRHRAWHCLYEMSCKGSCEGRVSDSFPFQHLEDVSTEAYYRHLLEMMSRGSTKKLREQLMIGFCSSFGGTDQVNRACCTALAAFIMDMDMDRDKDMEIPSRAGFVHLLVSTLVKHLTDIAPGDDRDVVPALGFMTFILDQEFASLADVEDGIDWTGVWDTIEQVHTSGSSSLERTNAVAQLYGVLARVHLLRTRSLDKLTRQLLHRYPKIRNGAADLVYGVFPPEERVDTAFVNADWNAAPTANKALVLEMRKRLKVAGAPAPAPAYEHSPA